MKRSIGILLLLCILCSLLGCGNDPIDQMTNVSSTPTSISTSDESGSEPDLSEVPDTPSDEPTEPQPEPTEPVTEPTTAPTQHSHSFSPVTCTDPKICSTCGETEGKAAGHIWKDATCTDPKTCKSCGDTNGSAAGHDYSDGVCQSCGEAQPNYSTGDMVWIPKSGKRYHRNSGCSNMKDPQQVTKSEAEAQGYTPCKKCY